MQRCCEACAHRCESSTYLDHPVARAAEVSYLPDEVQCLCPLLRNAWIHPIKDGAADQFRAEPYILNIFSYIVFNLFGLYHAVLSAIVIATIQVEIGLNPECRNDFKFGSHRDLKPTSVSLGFRI